MGKYEALAKDIIANVGGKGNIESLTHCVTRLRFQLKDEGQAKDDVLKNMKGVVTVMKSAGQYQVVIGNHVPQVYADVCEVAGISAGSASSDGPKKKKSVGATIIDFISGVFGPVLAVLSASGMVKGFLALFVFLGLMNDKMGLYQIWYACGDALFSFFPILLGFSCAKKLGGKPYLGAVIGAAMVYSKIQGVDLNLFGMMVNVTYTSTVIPILFTCIFSVWLEKKLDKIIPDVIKTFVTPMIVLVIAVPLGFCFIGIAANALSNGITAAIMTAYNLSPIMAGILVGGLWQVLVIFGIHQGLVAVAVSSLTAQGMTPIFSLVTGASFAQTAVVFAIWLKTKDEDLKEVSLPAWISGIFGVTEPAIYGVTLPRMKYFVISCIASAVGGAYIGATGVLCKIMGGMGIFSLPSYFGQSVADGVNIVIACLISMVIAGVATFILYKDEEAVPAEGLSGEEAAVPVSGGKLMDTVKIASPIKGEVMPLSDIDDAAFSGGALGKGVAIKPAVGEVYAPADGTLTTLFPTLHAMGITTDDGVEILVHVGLDTVNLNGQYFKAFAKQGDRVRKGDKLVSFDIAAIEKAGFSVASPVVITNTPNFLDVVEDGSGAVDVGDAIITVIR